MVCLRICGRSLWLSALLLTQTLGQFIAPSNNTNDLLPVATSPRFLLNGTEFGSTPPIRLAPLQPYAEGITKSNFLSLDQTGQLVNVDPSNINNLQLNQFGYLSCDPGAYTGYLNASQTFDIAFSSGQAFIIILYSETHDHCSLEGVDTTNIGSVNAVLTTVDPVVASMVAKLGLNSNSKGTCALLPDLNSFTNVTNGNGWDGGSILGPSPTTAVAMIILYSITGIITSLFVIIIITGAIRAHRHPERYGPRNLLGRGRQSRAKGIARAMLETLPIVKFGDHNDLPAKPTEGTDIEMNAAESTTTVDPAAVATADGEAGATRTANDNSSSESLASGAAGTHAHNPDGTQADGSLGCSICTEDFNKGEEVRVLPCNHKFHPVCVDPWLLNVSGTCPLCRIDLRPKDENGLPIVDAEDNADSAGVDGERGADPSVLPPPLESATAGPAMAAGVRRDTVTTLRGFASGTRDERIAALRRFGEERRRRGVTNATEGESERRGVRDRLRTRFRVRTTLGAGRAAEEPGRSGSSG